jgi:23S rRNA pseudouridine1911/1915/1917 synthase
VKYYETMKQHMEKKPPSVITVTAGENRLLWRGGTCMAINKLPGESPESSFFIAGEEAGKPWTAVHRLDVPVSGCLLLSRTPETTAFLSRAFSGGSVEKRYLAVVETLPPGAAFPLAEDGSWSEFVHWIGFDRKRNKSAAWAEKKIDTKKALLRCRLAARGDNYLFLEIDLLTGRHHQIRAQLAALGLRVKGDLKYGARRSEKQGGIRLHAASLSFPNPEKPAEILTVSAMPPLMDALWEAVYEGLPEKPRGGTGAHTVA